MCEAKATTLSKISKTVCNANKISKNKCNGIYCIPDRRVVTPFATLCYTPFADSLRSPDSDSQLVSQSVSQPANTPSLHMGPEKPGTVSLYIVEIRNSRFIR